MTYMFILKCALKLVEEIILAVHAFPLGNPISPLNIVRMMTNFF